MSRVIVYSLWINSLFLISCSPDSRLNDLPLIDDDIRIEFQELPQQAQDYITQTYPDVEVRWVKKDGEGDTQWYYEVKMSNGREIYFNEEGELVEDDD